MANIVTGVYETCLKDGTKSYRASITYKGKHIALGSFADARQAGRAYTQAQSILENNSWTLDSYKSGQALPFEKCVVLINYRDKGLYIPTPISPKDPSNIGISIVSRLHAIRAAYCETNSSIIFEMNIFLFR